MKHFIFQSSKCQQKILDLISRLIYLLLNFASKAFQVIKSWCKYVQLATVLTREYEDIQNTKVLLGLYTIFYLLIIMQINCLGDQMLKNWYWLIPNWPLDCLHFEQQHLIFLPWTTWSVNYSKDWIPIYVHLEKALFEMLRLSER